MRRLCNCSRKSNYERERDSQSQEENTITNSNADFEPVEFMEQIHIINMLETVLATASSFKRKYR
jgi:hypothetical protein